MDYINILQYEKWKKEKENITIANIGLDKNLIYKISLIINDNNFIKQKIIGANEIINNEPQIIIL